MHGLFLNWLAPCIGTTVGRLVVSCEQWVRGDSDPDVSWGRTAAPPCPSARGSTRAPPRGFFFLWHPFQVALRPECLEPVAGEQLPVSCVLCPGFAPGRGRWAPSAMPQ